MFAWIKQKLGVTLLETEIKMLRRIIKNQEAFIIGKLAELKEYTRVDADIGFRGNNTIVLTGVYRKQGFVRFYDIGDGQFERLVQQMKHMQDHALIRNIDAPPNFRGTFGI